jgi:HAD superfamily phosphoserine phosphatase-like hydrolase
MIPKNLMLKELENVVSFRQNFKNLVAHCNERNIPIFIVSAGLDFVIKHFLNLVEFTNINVHAPKTIITDNNIEIKFPLKDKTSIDFKEDLVKSFKKLRYQTIYVGDGLSDFNASKISDFSFSIKDSKLAKICKKKKVPHKEMVDFKDVIKTIISFD